MRSHLYTQHINTYMCVYVIDNKSAYSILLYLPRYQTREIFTLKIINKFMSMFAYSPSKSNDVPGPLRPHQVFYQTM